MPQLTPTKETDKVFQVANYFVQKSQEDPQKGLDSKKLQKLLYYSQAWNLVFNKEELFPNKIEAWIHGPAVYAVWDMFRTFDFNVQHPEIEERGFALLNEKEIGILDRVWNVYGKFDGEYLETLTHSELPWQEARKGLQESERSQNIITNESLKSYYGQRLAEAEQLTPTKS